MRRQGQPRTWRRLRGWLALMVVLTLVSAAPAPAVIQGDNGKFAYESSRGGSSDVWIAEFSGSGARAIAGNDAAARDGRPSWAPTAPLFVQHISPVTADVGDVLELTIRQRAGAVKDEVQIRWPGVPAPRQAVNVGPSLFHVVVPDGARTGRPCIGVLGRGSVRDWPARLLAPQDIVIGGDPVPSNDAADTCDQPLAFQSDRRDGRWDIWLFEPATASLRNATEDAPHSDEIAPAWSSRSNTTIDPIGVRETPLLAFASNRTGDYDIFVTDPLAAPGEPAINVTRSPEYQEANPDWSPDGRWLTFERERDGDRRLWILAIDPATDAPGAMRPVTSGLGPGEEPSWFSWSESRAFDDPPVDEIVFSGAGPEGDQDVHHVESPISSDPFSDPVATSEWTQTGPPHDELQPAWSPRGDRLLYAGNGPASPLDAAGDFDIYARSNSGADERVFLSGPGDELHPAWQPTFLQASIAPTRPRGRATPRRRAKVSSVSTPSPAHTTASTSNADAPETPPGRRDEAPAPEPPACTQAGSDQADRLVGTPGADVLCGMGGDDRVIGAGGDDRLLGGPGADQLDGRKGADTLRGGGGPDALSGGRGDDRLSGNGGRDVLTGGTGIDALAGGPGGDRILGADGRGDRISGGRDFDRASVDRGRDRVTGVERANRE